MIVSLREKGRITIPVSIRRALGLRVGDRLRLSVKDGTIILKPVDTVKAEDIKGIIGPFKVEIEEVEGAFGRDLS
ncbi:AbrB/MazE/SpoVT family DNA-binding domain-containing protein [Candidatus Bathyarchaeota archaeon]|nr:AbrB/MazE/SpoVT family DNA-binding domain-containing protein [Candidatus Bathyarchaeota archaeon]